MPDLPMTQQLIICAVVAFFGTFIVGMGGTQIYLALDPKKRQAKR